MLPSKANHYVVVDTNIFIYRTNLLRSPLGASLTYLVRALSGKLLLPEVVELELQENHRRQVTSAIDKATASLRAVREATGIELSVDLPDATIIPTLLRDRMDQLEPILLRSPLTVSAAKKSLTRMAASAPPSRNGQQFKDCAIWFATLELPRDSEVYLLSEDTGFFAGGDPKQGISELLKADAEEAGIQVHLCHRVEDYLRSFSMPVPTISEQHLRMIIDSDARSILYQLADNQRIYLGELLEHEASPYLTPVPDHVAFSFKALFEIDMYLDWHDDQVVHGTVEVLGEFLYDPSQNSTHESMVLGVATYDDKGHLLSTWAADDRPASLEPPLPVRTRHPFSR